MKLLKLIFSVVLLTNLLNAKDLTPNFTYSAKGGVTELLFQDNKLYAATTTSSVDIFDTVTRTKINSITLPQIKDFMGDKIDSKVYSIDVLNNKILIASQGEKGGRAINIFENDSLNEIISDKKNMFIAKAKFIDENKIIFALLSNEIYLYDLNKKENIKIIQVSHSKFSNFVLTEDKKRIIVADESGDLKMFTTKDLSHIRNFKNQNLDNVFQVDTKNGIIVTAGQDRRSAIYTIDGLNSNYKQAPFLIYSVGLSPSGKLAGIAINEENDVLIFDTKYKSNKHTLKQNPAILTNILFINENEVFVASDHEKINYYKID